MVTNDLISRQAAIDEIEYELEMINSALDSLTLDFNARERLRQRRGEAKEILNSIQQLPSIQTEPRWIPVEIKPPKEKKAYWVCTDTGYQCECRWTNNRFGMIASDEWGWSIFDTPQYTKVVAWCELQLPEPYRKEIEDE